MPHMREGSTVFNIYLHAVKHDGKDICAEALLHRFNEKFAD